MFLLLFSLINTVSVNATYFTMTDIKIDIPIDKGKSLPENRSLFIAYAYSDTLRAYSLTEGQDFFKISPKTGEVSLNTNLFQVLHEDTKDISGEVSVRDSSGQENRTSLTLHIISTESFDCDYIVQDICFWKSAHFRIEENTKPTVIGSLSSPYLIDICGNYKVNYNLLDSSKEFRIRSADTYWIIESLQFLDREKQAQYSLNILCTIENPQHTVRNVTRTINVTVMDVDDNLPVVQKELIDIPVASNIIRKGERVGDEALIFQDKDSPEVNVYEATILEDKHKILKPECKKLLNDYFGQHETAVHCKLKFTKSMLIENHTYPIKLQLNDTSLANTNKVVEIPIRLHFPDEIGQHPTLGKRDLRSPQVYPSNKVKIFRTAAPLARLTQPRNFDEMKYFKIITENPNDEDIFNITTNSGILFVHDVAKLRKASEYIRLNISWLRNKENEYDEIEIQVIDEAKKTCEHIGPSIRNWRQSCSQYRTPEKCKSSKACAIATSGSASVRTRENPHRCMWRGDLTPSTEPTNLYATCTPDKDTCPDGICDELEELHSLICPQDCTTNVLFPSEKNKNTGRGLVRGSGVCSCNQLQCKCDLMEFKKHKATKRPEYNTTVINQAILLQPNVNRHISNRKVLGVELSRCGTNCVIGIVAGVLFLIGAVALIVICWRLDRVNKAVRQKFNGENQDMTAPLSDYIDRSVPEPLPLNFDMTTSLANTTIVNILKKYTPDPKWEFPRSQLTIEQTLGEGEFGKVLRAKALNIAGQLGQMTVAVKTLKDDARESELNDLLSEYHLLKEVSHPNIIRLLGVCTVPSGPVYLIIEFAEHGSLRNYLRRSRHLHSTDEKSVSFRIDKTEIHYDEPNFKVSKITPREILSFAWQICKGMAYLSEIKLVHRDLAARNVLLAADKVCKISDFGLTRDIYEDDAYFKKSKGRVPVKWMAPESLSDHVYTNKSDVWSFGILVWELVTLGASPYPGIAVQNLFHLLMQGYRMERPDNCSPTLYNIMRSCWHTDPSQRPSFQQLSALWEKMLSEEIEYLDLSGNAVHNKSYFCSIFEDNNEATDKDEINPINLLSKSRSYIKCGSADKFEETFNLFKETDTNQNVSTQGYETPVKLPHNVKTPSNDEPQYYAEMTAEKKN